MPTSPTPSLTPAPDPWHLLCIEALSQAVYDLGLPHERTGVLAWITGRARARLSFRAACVGAGLDPDATRQRLLAHARNRVRRRRKRTDQRTWRTLGPSRSSPATRRRDAS